MPPRADTLPDAATVRYLSIAATSLPIAGLAASTLTRTWSWFYVSGAAGVVLFAGTAFASAARHNRLAAHRRRPSLKSTGLKAHHHRR